MRETADARDGGLFAAERFVDFIGVGLDRAGKTGKAAANRIEAAAGVKLQKGIASGYGIEPKVANSASAPASINPCRRRYTHPPLQR